MLYGLDLFTGIGGLTLALQDWVTPIAYCEREPYVVCWLLESMRLGKIPTAPICTDIRELRGDMCRGVDIIYGGFPCQDVSVAGARKGLDGERSGLFFEVVRLAKEIKPAFIFLENVPAIRTRGLNVVGRELANAGYDCRWDVIPAYEDRAFFEGKRWFCLAKAEGIGSAAWLRQWRRASGDEATCPKYVSPLFSPIWNDYACDLARVDDGLPSRVERITALGNAVVPAQGREAFRRLCGLNN